MPMPRKTDGMHKLTGTKSQAKTDALDFVCQPGRPLYPKGLTKSGRATFKRLSFLLEKRRALTYGDVEIIRLYALLYDRHAKALEKIEAEGEICVYSRLDSNGREVQCEKQNLWYTVVRDCEKNMVAILDRLGLTPNARAKVKPTAPGKPAAPTAAEIEEQQFLALLSRSNKSSTSVVPFVQPTYEEPATQTAEEINDEATSFNVD
jgi:P27 family predicted phage terminase small subunit